MAGTEPQSKSSPPPRLLIVAANQDELYDAIKQALNTEVGVEVVVDRRVGKRPPIVAIPNRAADPRESERVQEELLQRGWALARRKAQAHRCPRCLSSSVERMKPRLLVGLVLRVLRLRRYRCQPCRHRFFDKPLGQPSSYPR
jgi:predicted Zn-ribbon and HTH transcriptional regulator